MVVNSKLEICGNMNDIDSILSVVENPTRRKILRALVREPHYPLQLSKELGMTQQSVVKNLNIMERNGIVVSYRESSNIGPDRTFYRPNSQFTVVIDMRDGMFETNIVSQENKDPNDTYRENRENNSEELHSIREKISDIDKKICEIEKRRSNLIEERNELIRAILCNRKNSEMDYVHRNLLYEMLNRPDSNASEISEKLGMNETRISAMIDEIMDIFNTEE